MGWEREEAAYRAHGSDLMRFASALVGPSDAEDLVSSTVNALLQAGRWANADDMRAYALGAVARQAATLHRSTARRRIREHRAARLASVVDAQTTDPALLRALMALPLRQRSVLYLTYWEDLPPARIARMLGIGEGSVRRHLARGRATLRTTLR